MTNRQKICFVITGYGKKTSCVTKRRFDLDKMYQGIIKPTVEALGLICIRSDELDQRDSTDEALYALLLHAELVIADISVNDATVFYKLGIRHAVKPFSTILTQEKSESILINFKDIIIHQYEYLGESLSSNEEQRYKNVLTKTINSILQQPMMDSPVYSKLAITPPKGNNKGLDKLINTAINQKESLYKILFRAQIKMQEKNFLQAIHEWELAIVLSNHDPYVLQQYALATYQSKYPNPHKALYKALTIIKQLNLETSYDPETLKIAGTIYKLLWLVEFDANSLLQAVKYYKKSYYGDNSYSTGENYALCLSMLEKETHNKEDKQYYQLEAKKVYSELMQQLKTLENDRVFSERTDQLWIYATLSQCCFALGEQQQAKNYEQRFTAKHESAWQQEIFNQERLLLRQVMAMS